MASADESLGLLLADVSRLMRRAFRRRLDGSALTFAQARALVHLSRHEGVRQVELAELLELQPIALARLLDQLAAAGLVERREDPSDRRANRLYLTDAAQPHLRAIERVSTAIRADALAGIDARQARLVADALVTMRANLGAR